MKVRVAIATVRYRTVELPKGFGRVTTGFLREGDRIWNPVTKRFWINRRDPRTGNVVFGGAIADIPLVVRKFKEIV